MRILKAIAGGLWNGLLVLFTGGKYGSSIRSSKRGDEYAKRQERRRKDFEKFGGHGCKICDTRIPGNKQYCAPCYHKYRQ